MRFFDFLGRTTYLFLFLNLIFSNTLADPTLLTQSVQPPAGYYIVVAAYYSNGKSYAEKYAATFSDKGHDGKYAFFPEKQMFMVHLNRFDDFDKAIGEMRKVRREGIKDDAWVYVYKPDDIQIAMQGESEKTEVLSEDPNNLSETEQEEEPESEDELEPTPNKTPEDGPPADKTVEEEPPVVEDMEGEPAVVNTMEDKPEPNPYEGMYPVYFNLHHGVSADPVDGQVQVVDPEQARVVLALDGNQWHHIEKPSNTHSEVQLVADLFGYRKISHVIHLDDPNRDTTDYFVQVRNDSIFVDFELVRYHVGDIFTMYNVYFYSHSAIMRPESTYELDQLLAMLNENPNLKIILHGHTNGNSRGTMRYKTGEDVNLFSTTGALEKTASAKALSEERAKVVKRYLVNKGIDPGRMEIKGWGGRRMLYKKNDPQAIKNVRVEIEIVKE